MDSLLLDVDKCSHSIQVHIDLSVAFDTLDHTILLSQLTEVARFSNTSLKWFASFLSDRE
ncbi:hypothetical protein SGI36_21345, partial [Providencia rettgeri]